jgi:PAT family beta-lactamase induction signal transducer AmpG
VTGLLRGWLDALRVYRHPRVLAMLFLGFSAGLPFPMVFSTLSAWLRDFGVERATIGFFAWVGITYSVKVLWAPVVDRVALPGLTRLLGQRRSWMLLAQAGVGAGLFAMSGLDPSADIGAVVVFALVVAFSSATQDISVDAWRIEAVEQARQGAMAAAYNFGYRLAVLAGGAGALYIADYWNWGLAYAVMAALMGVGIVTTLAVAEPDRRRDPITAEMEDEIARYMSAHAGLWAPLRRTSAWIGAAVISPFAEFFRRNGRFALVLLALVLCFNISDRVLGIMANPFYLDLGFTKSQIASVTKVFGFVMTIVGAAAGGVLVARWGTLRTMLVAAVMLAATNLMFMLLALSGPDLSILVFTISGDNLSMGLAGVAFIAWLSSLTNPAYTATQYALFSSLMSLVGKAISGWSGVFVDAFGYAWFFVYAAATGIPAIVLVLVVMSRERAAGQHATERGRVADGS